MSHERFARPSIRVDNQIPVEEIQTLDQLHGQQLATPAVTTALLAIFAGVALLVTLAGLAGLVGTSVSQRTREFGLRMALGASRFSVLRLVLGQGLMLTVIGLVLGLGGAYVFSQLVTQFLFETTRTDIARVCRRRAGLRDCDARWRQPGPRAARPASIR